MTIASLALKFAVLCLCAPSCSAPGPRPVDKVPHDGNHNLGSVFGQDARFAVIGVDIASDVEHSLAFQARKLDPTITDKDVQILVAQLKSEVIDQLEDVAIRSGLVVPESGAKDSSDARVRVRYSINTVTLVPTATNGDIITAVKDTFGANKQSRGSKCCCSGTLSVIERGNITVKQVGQAEMESTLTSALVVNASSSDGGAKASSEETIGFLLNESKAVVRVAVEDAWNKAWTTYIQRRNESLQAQQKSAPAKQH